MKNQVIQIKPKSLLMVAIKWENNEPYIREFISDDSRVRFPENRLEIWNKSSKTWVNVPMFHYVVNNLLGELDTISPHELEFFYDIVTIVK